MALGIIAAMTGPQTPKENGTSEPATEAVPGQRSGTGAGSLWSHVTQDAQRKAAIQSSEPPDRSKHVVLVVDDNASGRYAVARALREAGYQTLEASGGAEALLIAANASAVVLDVHLPDLHGIEVCRLLRSDRKTAALPIIHVSAVYVEAADREAAREAGANAYMVAPVPAHDLVDAIDELVTRPR